MARKEMLKLLVIDVDQVVLGNDDTIQVPSKYGSQIFYHFSGIRRELKHGGGEVTAKQQTLGRKLADGTEVATSKGCDER